MTDARLERLTELARKAWPQDACHIYDCSPRSSGSVMHDVESQSAHVLVMAGDGSHLPLRIEHHPLALDALEAALCVLAGEPLPESCMRDCDGYWLQHKRAEAEKSRADKAEAQLAELKARLEQLHATMRMNRDGLRERCGDDDAADAFEQCADDLEDALKVTP